MQVEGEFTVIVGLEFTVTVATAVLEQFAPFVPVTVYCVVTIGEDVIDAEDANTRPGLDVQV
jgi:hypothetical protein